MEVLLQELEGLGFPLLMAPLPLHVLQAGLGQLQLRAGVLGSEAGAALFVLPPFIQQELFLLVELLEQLCGPQGAGALLLQLLAFRLDGAQGASALQKLLLEFFQPLGAGLGWGLLL